jgi:hypothetical protein
MPVQFSPCPRCARHVKRGAGVCPFCEASIPSAEPGPTRVLAGRLSRAALFAVGAAAATTDCSSPTIVPYGQAPYPEMVDSGGSDAADAGTPAPPTDAAGAPDVPMAIALYGAAAFDE